MSALSQNRFICLNVASQTHKHTPFSEALIITQGRIGNTSCQLTCTGLHSHANVCSLLLLLSFVVSSFSTRLGATMNTSHLHTMNQAGMINAFENVGN